MCDTCPARNECIVACEPGSIMCMINRIRSGKTHGDMTTSKRFPVYCQYCGEHLKVIGSERFCNNVKCLNRYKNV